MEDMGLILKLNKDWRRNTIKIKRAGGQTNRNYIVDDGKKKYFVRLPWESGAIDRKIEGKNILALVRNKKLKNVVPKYYIYILGGKNILSGKKEKLDLPDGAMMAEYIKGRAFTLNLFKKKEYQKKLVGMFHVFHTSGVRFVNKYNVFRDELAKYRMAVEKRAVPKFIDKETILELKKIEKKAQKEIPISKKGVAAHNDFIFQNFLTDKNRKIYLLDFEYAGMSEKGGMLYDFAFLFADNLFRKPAVNKDLFEKFLQMADKVYKKTLDRKQIYWLALVVPVMQIWWGLLRYFSVKTNKEKKYFKDYVLKRADGVGKLYSNLSK
jgi:thiamine kinase-like enzyme